MSLGKSILKHKKKLIYTIFAFILSQICFFNLGGIGLENNVYAADGDTETQDSYMQGKASELNEAFQLFQKIIYVFIYPLLVMAGKLVDNSFVYGEIFSFDAILWKLWNIVRNLANFGLGFIFIYKIFKYLIDKKDKVKDILLNALIAGIGIQASWFVMAALIDVSTILTYSIGGLPISVLKNNNSSTEQGGENLKYNPYVLKNVVYLEPNGISNIHDYMTNAGIGNNDNNFYISECETVSYKTGGYNDYLLLAPSMIYYKDENKNVKQTDNNRCHRFGQVYYFSELYPGINRIKCNDLTGCKTEQINYNKKLQSIKSEIAALSIDKITPYVENARLLEIGDAHVEGGTAGLGKKLYGDYQGLDLYNKRTGEGKTYKLQDILTDNSYVGVFTALYSSLINSVGIIPGDGGIFASTLNAALSLLHMLAIGIPLIAVCVVFMMRVGILWIAIALSPLIVLLSAFKLWDSDFLKNSKFVEYLKPFNLIKIIFSPAIVCFAISISTVLVTVISALNMEGIDTFKQDMLGGLIQLDIGGFTVPVGKLMVSMLGIAITWFLVRAAVQSSKLGDSEIIKGMRKLASSTLGAIPIIPVIGKDGKTDFIGANSAFGLNGQTGVLSNMMQTQKSTFEHMDNDALNDLMNPKSVDMRKADAYKTSLISTTPTGNWTLQPIEVSGAGGNSRKFSYSFNDVLPDKKKEIIDAINDLDKEKRDKFGRSASRIEFNDENGNRVIYEYKPTDEDEEWTDANGNKNTEKKKKYVPA